MLKVVASKGEIIDREALGDLVFWDGEVRFEHDEKTGRVKVVIPVDTVIKKLPNGREQIKAMSPYMSAEDVEAAFTERLLGVAWKHWASMNFAATKTGKRSINAYVQLLEGLAALKTEHGAERLNMAMAKCYEPKKCVIPYVRAILRNWAREDIENQQQSKTEAENGVDRDKDLGECIDRKFS